MSNEGTSNYYAYLAKLGPLGQVVCDQVSFFASKDRFPIGTYNSYDEAVESLAWKGRPKKQVEVTQIKDEIRYLSRSDKIEIYRWLDRELVSDLPYRIGSHRSITYPPRNRTDVEGVP